LRAFSTTQFLAAAILVIFIAATGAAHAQEYETLLKAGDQLYLKRSTNLYSVHRAIAHWNTAAALDATSAHPFHRIAMAYFFLYRFPIEGESRSAYLDKSSDAAKKALAVNPKSAQAHYWLAVVQYEQTRKKTATRFFQALSEIKSHLRQAKAADEKIYDGGPDRMLGHIASNSPIVKLKAATEHLEAALAISPDYHENLIAYATVISQRKRIRDARAALNKLLALHAAPGAENELRVSKLKAKQLLESLEK
jgi:hypothetical protein